MDVPAYGQLPGMGTLVQTGEAAIMTGREGLIERSTVVVSSAAVDAGSTPTSLLRAGLALGRITASGLYKQHDPAATDGSEVAVCLLAHDHSTLDYTGAAANKEAHVFIRGTVIASAVVNISAVVRRQLLLSQRFSFDDDPAATYSGNIVREIDKAANYQVAVADVGTLFTCSAATVFTLPAIAPGLGPFEFLNVADVNMGIASTEGDNIIGDGDVDLDSITFSTASHKIGARIRVQANNAGTKWLVAPMNFAAILPTQVD